MAASACAAGCSDGAGVSCRGNLLSRGEEEGIIRSGTKITPVVGLQIRLVALASHLCELCTCCEHLRDGFGTDRADPVLAKLDPLQLAHLCRCTSP